MKVAVLCSNLYNIDKENKTGTGIFNYDFICNLVQITKKKNIHTTVFASGASTLPTLVESIDFAPSSMDSKIIKNGKHIMFELALISKAFSQQKEFDMFHVNIGDGDLIMPFVNFVKKPILITLHNIINEDFTRKYFSLFKNYKNIFFVSVSNAQRKLLPELNYIDTIYHGIDVNQFVFDDKGGKEIMWAGRFIPNKGPDIVIQVAKKTKQKTKMFGVVKDGFEEWFQKNINNVSQSKEFSSLISLYSNFERNQLVSQFQKSKVFLSPILQDEAFGLVFVESMACGTPVVTFARGSTPEIVQDGQNGFLVNPSDDDIRGDWIIKKTGFAGLCEAVEKIYSMPSSEYMKMRKACRDHVVHNFSIEKMMKKYLEVYTQLVK